MQLQKNQSDAVWYFTFGAPEKTSLSAQYARQHNLPHLTNPSETQLFGLLGKSVVIETTPALLRALEPKKSQIELVFVGKIFSEEEARLKRQYESIGHSRWVQEPTYPSFRRELYPRLVFLYGPNDVQNKDLLTNYLSLIGFTVQQEAPTPNDIVKNFPKTRNYVFVGLPRDSSELAILDVYFHYKIIHLRHQRSQLPGHEEFFDQETKILPLLNTKSQFHSLEGAKRSQDVWKQIGEQISPSIIYANVHQLQDRLILAEYIRATDGLLLNINQIQSVWNRKPGQVKSTTSEKIQLLVHTLFRNFHRKEVFLSDFPQQPEEFAALEQRTRPITLFAEFQKSNYYQYSKQYSGPIYFLDRLKRRKIDPEFPLSKQLANPSRYLVVTGPSCSGKSSASKYIASQYGYNLIEYDPYVAALKEKLIAPEDGEELPIAKIIKHFQGLKGGETPILIDGLSIDVKDIEKWTIGVGSPTLINLKVEERELIRRTRKKNEGDQAVEVSQQESAKAKQLTAKNTDWIQTFTSISPESTLYQVDFSGQLLLGEKLLESIFKPRVFLVQFNETLLFQNVALRYDLGFFNLGLHTLQQVAQAVRGSNLRDVILCNYAQSESKLVLDDFYWIQKHIGTVRYLAIWSPESHVSVEHKLDLQRPPQPQKPKIVEGEEGEAPPAEEQGEKKKEFDIYQYEWTKPVEHKNLSQWFFKVKKQVKEREQRVADTFNGFEEVLQGLSSDKDISFYDRIIL